MKAAQHITLMTLSASIGSGLFSCGDQQRYSMDEPDLNISIEQSKRVTEASIRGLFIVNDKVGWASGSGGAFLRMTDGKTWVADTVPGYTHLDFRDVHAFDENTALLMAAGEEGRIIRTEDGGLSWVEVYTRLDTGIFLDGMDFYGTTGYCYGDPIDGRLVIIVSNDRGETWREVTSVHDALPKEAGFAASGTGVLNTQDVAFIATGGDSIARVFQKHSRLRKWTPFPTPLRSGEGCGIFSLAATTDKLIAVGGCYLDSANAEGNCAISTDLGRTWQLIAEHQPRGYRSCIAYSPKSNLLITCGRTGVEFSLSGWAWIPLSDDGYYTCSLADSTGWLMGRGGKMAKLSW
jgi:photosystem II stability/assembly factor-like uncharacterized protein